MKKSDLENGMILENREGTKYILIKDFTNKTVSNSKHNNILLNINFGGYDNLDNFNDNLTNVNFKELDIMKIYCLICCASNKEDLKLLWGRDLALEEFKDSLNKLNEVVKILKKKYILDVEIYNYSKDFTVAIKFYNFRLTHQEYTREIEELVRYKIKDIKEKSIDEIADDISNKIDKLILDYFKQ